MVFGSAAGASVGASVLGILIAGIDGALGAAVCLGCVGVDVLVAGVS